MKALKLLPVLEAERKLSDLRLSVCKECPFSKKSKLLYIINGNEEYTDTLMCEKCGCPCLQKTLVVAEQCPINKWL